MKALATRFIQACGLGTAAFVFGSAVEPAPAGAHCGDHDNSCGYANVYGGGWCDGPDWVDRTDYYEKNCSGTCYNGTQGCCDSPAACNDYPCKPGGCGSACAWHHSNYIYSYNDPDCS